MCVCVCSFFAQDISEQLSVTSELRRKAIMCAPGGEEGQHVRMECDLDLVFHESNVDLVSLQLKLVLTQFFCR